MKRCLLGLVLVLLCVSQASAGPRFCFGFFCRKPASCCRPAWCNPQPGYVVPVVEPRLVPVPAACPNCPRGVCPVGPEANVTVPACPGGCKSCDCPAGICPNCLPARR